MKRHHAGAQPLSLKHTPVDLFRREMPRRLRQRKGIPGTSGPARSSSGRSLASGNQ